MLVTASAIVRHMQYLGETLEVVEKACVEELRENGEVSDVIALDNDRSSRCDRVALVLQFKDSLDSTFSHDTIQLLGDVLWCGVCNHNIHAIDHDQFSRYHCAV